MNSRVLVNIAYTDSSLIQVLQFVQNGAPENIQSHPTDKLEDSTIVPERTPPKVMNKPTEERGSLHIQDGQMSYVDSSHWLSILQDIKELRKELSLTETPIQEEQSIGGFNAQPGADLVFGPLQSLTISEILQSLPPKAVCDNLLSYYFNFPFYVLRTNSQT